MQTGNPKDHILAVALRLFRERGLDAVSLRNVTAEAGVDIAAVNYYFGSKSGLLHEMTQQFFAGIHTDQLERLAELEADGQQHSVEDLLSAYAEPIFALFESKQGRDWVQAWLMARRDEEPRHATTRIESAEVIRRYYETLRGMLSRLPPDELWWRFERATNLLMANQGKQSKLPLSGDVDAKHMRQIERKWLITFLAGALQSPQTPLDEMP